MSRCAQHGNAHRGDWTYCPWCGSALTPKPTPTPDPVPYGTCRFCGGPAASEGSKACAPCWLPRMARRYLRGHTLADLATRVVAGDTWKQIAVAFGVPRPRRGPEDVRTAAWCFFEAAGAPGSPARPEVVRGEHAAPCRYPKAVCRCPEWVRWRQAREAVIAAWLRAQATDGEG